MGLHMSQPQVLPPKSKHGRGPYCIDAKLRLARQVEELQAASLENKREILHAIPVVTMPVSAAFLGVNEANLRSLQHNCNGLFGAQYAGRQCYSAEELILFAKNQNWMSVYTNAEPQEKDELPPLTMLDHLTFVDDDIAMAFTNLSYRELCNQVRESNRSHLPCRLSDLEKIRIAKLDAIA